jgi:hypothetical protein
MAVKNRNILKSYFETGDKPTEAQFIDLIDSMFNISEDSPVQGTPGVDGNTVMLRKTTTHLQWKYPDDEAWTDIVALSEITGPQGDEGERGLAGREIELQQGTTHIQYRYIGDVTWIDLIPIADITGAAGTYTALQLRDLLQTLTGIDMLDSNKVKYEGETSVHSKLVSLNSAVSAKQQRLFVTRIIYDAIIEAYSLTISGNMSILQMAVNRVPYSGAMGASYNGMDFKYQVVGGNTVVTLNPGLGIMFMPNDIIDIIYSNE